MAHQNVRTKEAHKRGVRLPRSGSTSPLTPYRPSLREPQCPSKIQGQHPPVPGESLTYQDNRSQFRLSRTCECDNIYKIQVTKHNHRMNSNVTLTCSRTDRLWLPSLFVGAVSGPAGLLLGFTSQQVGECSAGMHLGHGR